MRAYSELFATVEEALGKLRYDRKPAELYEPIGYMLSLGGKRLRPVLVLMAADLFGQDVMKALPAALAIEVFHNFTLVHDDIMDNAAIRRGQPTVYKKWDQTVAILSGDLMMIKAIDLLCETETTDLKSLIAVFNKSAADVCEGQQLDMNFESRQDVSVEEYTEMISLKTAALLGASLKIGAMVANAPAEDAAHLYEFGKCIGIAFQVQDDILDTFGEGEKVGKKIGGDIAANKKTLLYLHALERADADTSAQLKTLYSTKPEDEQAKVDAVLSIFNRLQILPHAEQLKAQYMEEAFRHLEQVHIAEERKAVLKKVAADLMQRVS